MSHPPTESSRPWTPLQRGGFRFVFVYYAMFAAASLLDSGPAPRALLARLRDPAVSLFARGLFDAAIDDRAASVRVALAQQIAAFLVAAAIATVWSLASRRLEYRRLSGWFRIALRYYVGVIMLVYGGLKLIDTQFPPIPIEQLSEPLGAFSPMGLLWTYMGYSQLYTSFTGFGECLGAFLLFFRRTTTAGALILVAVLSNVAMINYVYDVPVKQLSANLLFAAILVAATDIQRLVDVFIRNVPAAAADLSFPLTRTQQRLQSVIRPLIITLAVIGPLTASYFIRRNVILHRPPLYGVYDVVRFEQNGIELPPLTSDSIRWRRATFTASRALSLRLMTDTTRLVPIAVDTAAHRVILKSVDMRWAGTLQYRAVGADSLELAGHLGADSTVVLLRRVDVRRAFRLAR